MDVTGTDGDCLVCHHPDWRLIVRSPDHEYGCGPAPWDLAACRHCGHVQIRPIPTPEQIPSLYPPTYYTVNPRSPIYMDGPAVEQKMERDARGLRSSVAGLQVQSIVDVGGGNLTRLVKLKEAFQASEAICLDLQFDDAVLEAARRAGVKAVTGNIETDLGALRDGGHQLIILRQLIEHLRDPRAALAGLHRKLAPGGLLIIDTPNRGGWDYWLFPRKYWAGWHIPRHFHIFNQVALVRLCQETGYEISRKGYTPSIAFWIVSLRNWLGLNSIERSRSIWEFLNLKNLPIVGSFYILDLIWSKLGGETSNQFLFARKPQREHRADG